MKETADGYANFVSRVGMGAGNSLSGARYLRTDLGQNRDRLDTIYRTSWVAGAVVDCIAEDMTRAGVDFQGEIDADSEARLQKYITRKGVWHSLNNVLKWARLYGGAIAVIDIDGQDLSTPLNLDSISSGAFRGLRVFTRWETQPSLNDLVFVSGLDAVPAEYQVMVAGKQTVTIHHSRVLRFIGTELPVHEAQRDSGWGASVLERLYDRLVYFDNVTAGAAQLVEKAHLRVVRIQGLRETLRSDRATDNVAKMFDLMRYLQTNEGITLLDGTDEYQAHAYSFGGLGEMVIQFGQQIAGACGIPLVRLFGQSPAGLNSTGESDLRMYYDSVLSLQESRLRDALTRLFSVCYRSCFGSAEPADFDFSFNPLWQMSGLDKTAILTNVTNAVTTAFNAGIIDNATALEELKRSAVDTGVFATIGDEQVSNARMSEPPVPDDVGELLGV